jgi:hypothetical protein
MHETRRCRQEQDGVRPRVVEVFGEIIVMCSAA